MASPFRYFRKHQKVFLAFAVLIAMFVFVIGDLLTGMIGQAASGPQNPTTTVAEWDGGDLNVQELDILTQRRYFVSQALQRLQIAGARRVIEEGGNPTAPPVPNFIIQENETPKQVRIGVVTTRILADQAKDAGMSVSNEMINHYLKEFSFRRVNEAELISVLQSVRQAPPQVLLDQLFEGLRELLLGNTYLNSYSANVRNVLPEQRWEDWQRINNRISLEVAQLPVKDFVDEVPEPSESEVLAFYNANKDRVNDAMHMVMGARLPAPDAGFKEPQRVKLDYIVADVNSRKEKLRDTITDEEISDYYERNKRSQFVKTGSSTSPFDESLFDAPDADSGAPADAESAAPESSADESADPQDAATEQETEEGSPGEESLDSEENRDEGEAVEEEASETSPGTEETDSPAAVEEEVSAPEETAPGDEPSAEAESSAAESADATEDGTVEESSLEERAEEGAEEVTGENGAAESPAEDDSSAVTRESPFRLAAFQADLAQAEAEQSDASAEEADSDAPATEEGAEDGADEATEDEELEFIPLLDVKDSIRDKLATDKAVQELKKVVDSIYGDLSNAYKKYGTTVVEARSEGKEIPPPPAGLTNLTERAKEAGLVSEESVPLTFLELAETVVGRAVDYQSQNRTVTEAAFTSLQKYEPMLAQDLDANWYIVSKVEDTPERIPELDEIRDEVIAAWKQQEAAKLALKKAEELAAEVEKAGGSLSSFFAGKPFEVVTTDLFSWLTFGNTPYEMQRGPRLGDAPPLESIGPDFMTTAFELDDDDVAAELNYDHTTAYVMKLSRRERTEEELRKLFLTEANNWYGGQVLSMARWQNQQRVVLEELTTRVGLNLDKLEEFFSEEDAE